MASAILGFIAFIFAERTWMAFAILTLTALQGLAHPSLSAMMSRRVSAEQQGEVQGFIGSITAVASILAPLMLNEPLSYFTSAAAPFHFPGAAFAVAAVIGLISLLMLVMTPAVAPTRGSTSGG
jgi:DHA1 family tetracycline resistance protein-like MFS transporter